MTEYLYKGLETVYSKEDREMLDRIRVVLSVERLLLLTVDMSTAVVAQREVTKFIEAAEFIDQEFEAKYEKAEVRNQFKTFVEKPAAIGKMKNSEKLSSLEIIVMMMNTEAKRWWGCEAVMDIICQAATMKSVESVVESWVSVLEHHASKTRNIKADTIQEEMMISLNGPLIQHSKGEVEETMKAYWGKLKTLKDGHFTRRCERVKSFIVSKSVDSLNSQPVKTPFIQ